MAYAVLESPSTVAVDEQAVRELLMAAEFVFPEAGTVVFRSMDVDSVVNRGRFFVTR